MIGFMHIQERYLHLIKYKLDAFSKKKSGLYNFRCPFCGDSTVNKAKCRGYMFAYKSSLMYKCHNCGISTSFKQFIEYVAPDEARAYGLDLFKSKASNGTASLPDAIMGRIAQESSDLSQMWGKKLTDSESVKITPIHILPRFHEAYQYLAETRKIPVSFLSDLWYCQDFNTWCVEKGIKDPPQYAFTDAPRVVIPFRKSTGNLIGMQGRAISNDEKLRYITAKIATDTSKIWGLDRVDTSKPVFILEGAFDAMFIDNAIAMNGSDLNSRLLEELAKPVFVMDNEPRAPIIVKKISKLIAAGHHVVVWNDIPFPEKDVNSMILAGWNKDGVNSFMRSHCLSGVKAQLQLNAWRKV